MMCKLRKFSRAKCVCEAVSEVKLGSCHLAFQKFVDASAKPPWKLPLVQVFVQDDLGH